MNKKPTTKYDLEDRLIEFAVRIPNIAEAPPKTVASNKTVSVHKTSQAKVPNRKS
ncbi:MAG: hypothetical protein NW218_04715 [Saprospiraceae bacterium]|nr:hypothetical protein [Saprospiraceae bacterium]